MNSSRVALVVGIGDFDDGPLKYAYQSAMDVFHLFISEDYGQCDPIRSKLLTDEENPVTEEVLDQIIKGCLKNMRFGETFIFYYTGHATPIGSELYLRTNDTTDIVDGYRLSNLTAEVRGRETSKVILIIDACYSSVAFETISQFRDRYKNIAFLASSGPHQFAVQDESLKRSLFTHYFCEGVRLGCPNIRNNGSNVVEIKTIKDYINEQLQKNHPHLVDLQETTILVSEGNEKIWITKVNNSSKELPRPFFNSDQDIFLLLDNLQKLYASGYITPEKCVESITHIRSIQKLVKNLFQYNHVLSDILEKQVENLVPKIQNFQNLCLSTNEETEGLRENISKDCQQILDDLDFYLSTAQHLITNQ